MALINCQECGKEISDKSQSCIHCGYPVKKERIKNISCHFFIKFPTKKIILAYLCLSLLFVLASLFIFELSYGDTFGTLLMVSIIFFCILLPITIIKSRKLKDNDNKLNVQKDKKNFVNNSTNMKTKPLYVLLIIVSMLIINIVYLLSENNLFNNTFKNISIFGNFIASLVFGIISLSIMYIKNISNLTKKIFLIISLLSTICFIIIFDMWLINKSNSYKDEYVEIIQVFKCEDKGGIWVNNRCLIDD